MGTKHPDPYPFESIEHFDTFDELVEGVTSPDRLVFRALTRTVVVDFAEGHLCIMVDKPHYDQIVFSGEAVHELLEYLQRKAIT